MSVLNCPPSLFGLRQGPQFSPRVMSHMNHSGSITRQHLLLSQIDFKGSSELNMMAHYQLITAKLVVSNNSLSFEQNI